MWKDISISEDLTGSIFTQKMEVAERPSQMLVSFHITMWCHVPEAQDMNL